MLISDGVFVQKPQARGEEPHVLNPCSTVAYILNMEERLQHKLLTTFKAVPKVGYGLYGEGGKHQWHYLMC